VYMLSETLKVPRPHAIGLLVCLWTWALDNALDGDLGAFPPKAITDACGWTKKPDTLINALVACGWVDRDMRLHDWSDYAGEVADLDDRRREQARKRQARRRSRNESPDDDQNEQIPDDDHNECHANVTRDTSVTSRPCHAPTYTRTYTGTLSNGRNEGRNPTASITRAREANLLGWFLRFGQDDRWGGLVSGGEYTHDQLVGAAEYLERRASQGVLKRPFEYAIALLEDWRARGIATREEIEDNRATAWECIEEG
jgi:hypothetical protein